MFILDQFLQEIKNHLSSHVDVGWFCFSGSFAKFYWHIASSCVFDEILG